MKHLRTILLAFTAVVALAKSGAAQPGPVSPPPPLGPSIKTDVVDVMSGNSTIRYLLLTPLPLLEPKPTIAVILFAGGTGLLGITDTGGFASASLAQNFLVRSRGFFTQHNVITAIVDAPDGAALTQAERWSAHHASLFTRVIADLRGRSGARKIWLVGTSSGSLSVANIAGTYPRLSRPPVFPRAVPNASRPDGIVLTSSQTDVGDTAGTHCRVTVFDKPRKLPTINVPALVVADRSDACPCTPAKRVSAIVNAMVGSPAKTAQIFPLDGSASPPGTNPDACTALMPHGFYGIESTVVAAIAAWVKTH